MFFSAETAYCNTQSPYVYADNNPVLFKDINGEGTEEQDWHPDKQGNLIADEGDVDENGYIDKNKLTSYLDEIGVKYNDDDLFRWTVDAVVSYSGKANSVKLTSSSGQFVNLVGKLLVRWSENVYKYKTSFSGYNCSPTTFNRVDKAVEFVYGKDFLGKLQWSNPNYRHWQKASKNSLSFEQQKYFDNAAVGVISYLNLGYEVNLQDIKDGKLKPGAILNLKLGTSGHSVIFINYIYDNGQITGFKYWETKGKDTSTFGKTYDWQIRKAANFY